MEQIFIAVSIFGNPWIWRIFSESLFIWLVLILTTLLLIKRPNLDAKKLKSLLFILLLISTMYQVNTTKTQSLTAMSNDDVRLRDYRLGAYPPIGISLGDIKIWVPVAHWFEGRRESITIFRILDNFSESIDPNLYFFANHPRERIGVKEFEAFPYILFPLFLIGFFEVLNSKFYFGQKLILFASLTTASLIGINNPLGNIILFPFISSMIFTGLIFIKKHISNIRYAKMYCLLGVMIFLLFLAQTIIYEII